MSRSYRKTPIFGTTTADSEKKDKRLANRKYRRSVRQLVDEDLNDENIPDIREMSDVWSFDKDGKRFYNNEPELMRK